jgi:hypothetical protein
MHLYSLQAFNALITHSCLVLSNIPLSGVPQFINLLTDGQLGCFSVLAIMNKTVETSVCRFCRGIIFQYFLWRTKDHSCWILFCEKKIRICSKVAIPFCISTSNEWAFPFTSMPGFGLVSVNNFGHYNELSVVFHCVNLGPSGDTGYKMCFHMLPIWHLHIFSGKVLWILVHFFPFLLAVGIYHANSQ